MSNIETWSTTAASNNAASPNGWPENMSSAGLNDSAREMMAAVAKAYQGLATYGSPTPSLEWLDLSYGKTITRVSDTQVTVGALDVTSWATANRRIRILSGSAQADGFVVSSSFSVNTTINVLMDAGVVPGTPTKVLLHVGASLARGAFSGDASTLDSYDSEQLLPGLRNRLINGRFDVWQRGTSFTTDAAYTADRWKMTLGTSGAATITRQTHTLGQTDVPGEPAYYLRWVHGTNSSSAPCLEQRIESVRTLAGQTVMVSFYAKASSAIVLTGKLRQSFGTTGSPSANVDTSLGTFTMTTSWARYTYSVAVPSITGKTLGSDGNDYLSLRIEMPTGATFTLEISNAQVEKGSVVTTFENRPVAVELPMCQRFYAKTFPQGTAPAQNAGTTGSVGALASGTALFESWMFPSTMRATPTITTYAPDAATSNWSGGVAASAYYTSDALVNFYSASAAADQNAYSIHVTADAEL